MREEDFGQYVLWNESSALIFGTTAREALGRTVADVMSPAYAETVEELDRKCFQVRWCRISVQVHQRPDGKQMTVHIIRAPIFDEDGNVEFVVTAATDITTESARIEQLELAAKVFAMAAEGIIVSDADDRVLMVNAGFTRLTGFAADEIVGMLLSESPFRPIDKAASDARMIRLRKEGTLTSEVARFRKDGVPLSLWISASIVKNSDGSLRNYVRVFTDISLLKETQQKLEQLASFDALTELPNRRLLVDRLEQATRRAQRGDDGLSVMFIDLDGFKQVNDTFGHDVGDRLLQEVAQRLQRCIRTSDSVGRIGGDEFAVVLEKARDPAIVTQVGKRILSALAEPYSIDGHEVRSAASIGVATYPVDGSDAAALLKSADEAMYGAKRSGRSRMQFSSAVSPAMM